ncbi:hypothetical protein ACJX0J_009594, partial [Zea mays]
SKSNFAMMASAIVANKWMFFVDAHVELVFFSSKENGRLVTSSSIQIQPGLNSKGTLLRFSPLFQKMLLTSTVFLN